MKISRNQMFRVDIKWVVTLVLGIVLASSTQSHAQNGENLFKANCASCHQMMKDGTGPKLYGVSKKWADAGAEEYLSVWIKNWQVAAAENDYAKSVSQWAPTAMKVFGNLSDEDVTSIIDYIDAYEPPAPKVAGPVGGEQLTQTEAEGGLSWIWYLLGIIFVVIILSVGGVRRQLKVASGESTSGETESYGQEFRTWAYNNKKFVGLGVFVIVISLIVGLFLSLYSINVMTGYQPSQPIEFPHSKHAGLNGIDCKYCHNSVDKSKSAGIPTVNVCMNCHKQIGGEGEQVAKIQKIYDAAGFDPSVPGGGAYTGETEPIVWNKVHNLPDHVYFNHSQHVVVGGIDCKQCHGDMTKQNEVAKVVPVEELNMIDGNVKLTKPTLTMGWCIECHGEKEIAAGPVGKTGGSGYYDEIHERLLNNDRSLYEGYLEDDKVTVKELGGWECAKCHY